MNTDKLRDDPNTIVAIHIKDIFDPDDTSTDGYSFFAKVVVCGAFRGSYFDTQEEAIEWTKETVEWMIQKWGKKE